MGDLFRAAGGILSAVRLEEAIRPYPVVLDCTSVWFCGTSNTLCPDTVKLFEQSSGKRSCPSSLCSMQSHLSKPQIPSTQLLYI